MTLSAYGCFLYALFTRCRAKRTIGCADRLLCFREQKITIADVGTEYTNISFLHECIHGFMEALGINVNQHDEVLVDGLAHQLFEFLSTNKLQEAK